MKRIITVTAILILIFFAFSCTSFSSHNYLDVKGRFSYKVHKSLHLVNNQNSDEWLSQSYILDSPEIEAVVLAVKVEEEMDGLAVGFSLLGLEFNQYAFAAATGMGDWKLEFYSSESDNDVAIAYQIRESVLYGLFVYSNDSSVDPSTPPFPIMDIINTFSFTEIAGEPFRIKSQEQLESYMQDLSEKNGGSISVAVLLNNSVNYQYTSGYRTAGELADCSTAFNWGSITKIMTAIAIMHLVETEQLSLDDKVQDYIPEFSTTTLISIKQLLTHSSGIPDLPVVHLIGWGDRPAPGFEETFKQYNSQLGQLDFEPGSNSVYNNWNFLLLALIYERITQSSMLHYVESQIFEPFGMNETAYFYKDLKGPEAQAVIFENLKEVILKDLIDQGADLDSFITQRDGPFLYMEHFDILPAWGGIRSTARDSLILAEIFLNQGEIEDERLLKKDTVREMLRLQVDSTGEAQGFGLGWHLGSDEIGDYVQHPGGGPGINSLLRFYPDKEIAVAVMANFNDINVGLIAEALADLTLNKKIGEEQ